MEKNSSSEITANIPKKVGITVPRETFKPKSNAAESLREFLVDGLKDLYWAETQLSKALLKMAKNATSTKLREALSNHYIETDEHINRLESVFKSLGEKAKAVKCDVMEGLIKKSDEILEATESGAVRDAAIIAAAQKMKHYEIASYGTLVTYCQLLDENDSLKVMKQTLDEEKKCDALLNQLAVSEIFLDAVKS